VSTLNEKKAWVQPPITLDFSVPMFTASGLRIRFLKVWERMGYQSTKWVRYLCNSGRDTKNGSYEIRCQ
jgi:AP-2 complex subunit mu-1